MGAYRELSGDHDDRIANRLLPVVAIPKRDLLLRRTVRAHLLSALPERRHARPPIHLPNTLREQTRHAPEEEKTVDTALAADLLSWARSDPGEWALILSEDDDFVPPVFTAEAWTKPHGGRVYIVRSHKKGPYLKLDGLLMETHR